MHSTQAGWSFRYWNVKWFSSGFYTDIQILSCTASLTKDFKAPISGSSDEMPMQYHWSPLTAVEALNDSSSTPAAAKTPENKH